MPYPDDWYNNAAVTVQEMDPPFSIQDPEKIREYYCRLFDETTDKRALRKAIEAHSFTKTAEQYRLIESGGAQVIVPYGGELPLYKHIAKELHEQGVTGALLREAAPLTLTCFEKNLGTYAEEIPFARRGRERQTADSGVYLLLPQYYKKLYSPKLGLHIPQEEQEEFDAIF